MGGIGSGNRWRWGTRNTVEDMKELRIGRLASKGWLTSGRTCSFAWSQAGRTIGEIRVTATEGRIVLTYRSRSGGDDWQDHSYPVQIEWTPCHLGGARPWFLCPAQGCGRRVAILYGGAIFACRHCHRLAYPSENESRHDRATRQAEKLRDRLQWPPGILEGSGWGKPKHMHHATYRRLVAEYEKREAAALGAVMNWLERFDGLGS
ncbi:hypothetical protein U5922_014830 [Aquicoccus sp. G2-2]|uniref:hypothetical protein n=1 Tax=Aquicoccus sp. G2-2 TaxID=3092120 RepID=UPI002AE0581B|nr:hypothetical protein [Aquicoccus sp. G2-2]MEA1114671.1 hypothetical protein [Aquicoccus sp. G2-2]